MLLDKQGRPSHKVCAEKAIDNAESGGVAA